MSNINPERSILTTDFGTLKNDDSGTVSVSLPATTLAPGELKVNTQDINIGTINASTRIRVSSTKDGGEWYAARGMSLSRSDSGGFGYSVVGSLARISPTTLRVTISAWNHYDFSLTMSSGTETINFEISTFLSPFA